jgi:hypothetical protein
MQFRCKLAVGNAGIICAGDVPFVCDSGWQGVRCYFAPELCETELWKCAVDSSREND